VKVLCPRGHRVAEVTREDGRWVIETVPDISLRLVDGQAVPMPRYPAREPLGARPWRMLACRRECMRIHSWYRAESAELERLASAGKNTYRMPHPDGMR
jgi:hypothetical protein